MDRLRKWLEAKAENFTKIKGPVGCIQRAFILENIIQQSKKMSVHSTTLV